MPSTLVAPGTAKPVNSQPIVLKKPSEENHSSKLSDPLLGRCFSYLDYLTDCSSASPVCRVWARKFNPDAARGLIFHFPEQNRLLYRHFQKANPNDFVRESLIGYLKRCEQFNQAFVVQQAPFDLFHNENPSHSNTLTSAVVSYSGSNSNSASVNSNDDLSLPSSDLFQKGPPNLAFSSSPVEGSNNSMQAVSPQQPIILEPLPIARERQNPSTPSSNADRQSEITIKAPPYEKTFPAVLDRARQDIQYICTSASSATNIFNKIGLYDPSHLEDFLLKISQTELSPLKLNETIDPVKLASLLDQKPETKKAFQRHALLCSTLLKGAYEAEQYIQQELSKITTWQVVRNGALVAVPAWTPENFQILWRILPLFSSDKRLFRTFESQGNAFDVNGNPEHVRLWDLNDSHQHFFEFRQRIILGLRELIQNAGCCTIL